MTRRLTLAAAVALLLGGAGAASAQADTSVRTSQGRDYVACVAVDHVNVGTCVREPVSQIRPLLPW